MRVFVFFFGIVFLMCYTSIIAMRQLNPRVIASTIIEEMHMVRSPLAIACTSAGKLIILDSADCEVWNYKKKEVLRRSSTGLDPYQRFVNKIYVHPKKDIFIIPNNKGSRYVFFNNEDRSSTSYDRLKDQNFNVIFCGDHTSFCTIKDNKLIMENAVCSEAFDPYCGSILPGILFAQLSPSCFLCCDRQEKSIYKLTLNILTFSTSRLFDFCAKLDLANWGYYSDQKKLYAITQSDRKLYVTDIETHEQKILSYADNFKVGTLVLLPNQRILVLLSLSKDCIWYIDTKKMQHILTTTHAVSLTDMSNTQCGQVLAVDPDGQEILLAMGHKCLRIKIPLWIREFDAYEKYREIIRQLDIPKELQWLIAQSFVYSVVRNKKTLKESS